MRRRPALARQPTWYPQLVDGFLRHLARRGRRSNTFKTYRTLLFDLGEWLEVNGVASISSLRLEAIERWQDDLGLRAALNSQRVATTAVKGLLKWCARQDLGVAPNFFLQIDTPTAPVYEPRPISREDFARLQLALTEPDWSNLERLRTRALFWTLYSTGSRIMAALSLDRDSIKDGTARIIQKGGAPHTLVFSAIALTAIGDYLSQREDDHPALFVRGGGPGKWHVPDRLSSRLAQRAFDELANELAVQRFVCHRLRHTCATTMLRSGVQTLIISKHLGHRSPAMLATYAEVGLDQRREAIATLSVGAGLSA